MPRSTTSTRSGGLSVAGTTLSKSSNQFLVEKIVTKRYNNEKRRTEYLIKWEGYESAENTWEPRDNIYCKDMLAKFEKERKKQKEKRMEERREVERKKAEKLAKKKLARQNRAPGIIITDSDESHSEEDRKVLEQVPVKTEKTSKVPKRRTSTSNEKHTPTGELSSNREVKKEVKTINVLQDDIKKSKAVTTGPSAEKKEKNRKAIKPVEVDLFHQTPTLPNKRKMDKITGFDKGFQVEKLIGITKSLGEIMFFVKWRNRKEQEMISSRIVNKKCPRKVIKFYEDRLLWATNSTGESTDNFPSDPESEGHLDLKGNDKGNENIRHLKTFPLSPDLEEKVAVEKPQTINDGLEEPMRCEIQKAGACDSVVEIQVEKPESGAAMDEEVGVNGNKETEATA